MEDGFGYPADSEPPSEPVYDAVVIDTSSLPYGALNVATLAALADDLDQIGVDVWLPEPVAWEFAAHAADRLTEIRKPVKDAITALKNAGIDTPTLPYANREEAIEAVLARLRTLHARIEVLACSGSAAREALRDQVTERGAGKKVGQKRTHKTGGSDAAWIRTVHETKGGVSSTYVVMSANKSDVNAMFKLLGVPPPRIVPDEETLRHLLFSYEKAPFEAAVEAARLLRDWLTSGDFEDYAGLGEIPLTPALLSSITEEWDFLDHSVEVSQLSGLAGVEDVEVAGESGTVTLTASVIVDLTITGWFHDDVNGELVSDIYEARDVVIRVPLVIQGSQGKLINGYATDEPEPFAPGNDWSDPDDALMDCTALLGVPDVAYGGAEGDFLKHLLEDGTHAFRSRNGVEVTAELERRLDEEWRLRVTAGEQEIELVCEYDSSTWVGGSAEGMHMEPPYFVSVTGDTDVERNAAWALDEFLVRHTI